MGAPSAAPARERIPNSRAISEPKQSCQLARRKLAQPLRGSSKVKSRVLETTQRTKGKLMIRYAVIFLVIALVAALLGFGGLAGMAASIAKILFFVFLVLAAISFLVNLTRGGGSTLP